MRRKSIVLGFLLLTIAVIAGCSYIPQTPTPTTQIVLLGESFASGAEAVKEVNNAVANATSSGCKAISVGGYGAALDGFVIGVPVLVECPLGTQLLPDGTVVP